MSRGLGAKWIICDQVYGELEYVFGSIKMLILVMTIFLLLIIDTMKRAYSYLKPVPSPSP